MNDRIASLTDVQEGVHVQRDYARRCVETGVQLLVESQGGRVQEFGKKQWPVGVICAEGLGVNSTIIFPSIWCHFCVNSWALLGAILELAE